MNKFEKLVRSVGFIYFVIILHLPKLRPSIYETLAAFINAVQHPRQYRCPCYLLLAI
jgi:hypothetical protein